MQYPNKDLYGDEMDWREFCTLLSGIMPETPLGQIVSIRAEENKDTLQSFTKEQHNIRNEWRTRQAQREFEAMTESEKQQKVAELQEAFARAFK